MVAFAQLADDVRAMSNFIPDNTFIPGFYMDVPGVDTWQDQKDAIAAMTDPVVALGTLPDNVFPTESFEVTASLSSRTQIAGAKLRIKIDAPSPLKLDDVTATAKGGPSDGQAVPFTVDSNGDLVGWWGPPGGFDVEAGYNVSTTFDAMVAGTAPTGAYDVTLVLVDGDGVERATDKGTITVNDKVATVLWGDPMPKFTTQGTWATIPLRVYAPTADGTLTLTVAGPGDDPYTTEDESLAAGDVKVYGEMVTDMVAMALTFDEATKKFTGTWPAGVGFSAVNWYASVAAGAPVGNYTFSVGFTGGTLTPAVIYVYAPESHGMQPPAAGEDTTPPVVTITPDGTPGSTATFALAADEDVMFECQLVSGGGEPGETWEGCSTSASPAASSSQTYADLEPGDYLFAARGTDKVGLVSTVVTFSWTVVLADTTPPIVTIASVGDPGTTAAFALEADEPATFECRLTKDDTPGTWEDCTPPVEYTALEDGTYVFSARATDEAGNTSAEASSERWTVYTPPGDTTPPVVTITPEGEPGATASFTLSADESATFECQLTRNSRVLEGWATCPSSMSYTDLKVGTYVFSARATDAAGNTSTADTETWTVKKG